MATMGTGKTAPTRLGGRPIMAQLAMSALAGPGMAARRKISQEARDRRSARISFADKYGLSRNVNDWDSDTIEKARTAGWLPTEAASRATSVAPTPENVQASVTLGNALAEVAGSGGQRMLSTALASQPGRRRQESQGGVLQALRAIGLKV